VTLAKMVYGKRASSSLHALAETLRRRRDKMGGENPADGQLHRSVHGSGHDDRCNHEHRPMEVSACQVLRWRCTNARRFVAR